MLCREPSFVYAGRIALTWMEQWVRISQYHIIGDLISLIEHGCPMILEIVNECKDFVVE